MKARLFHPWCTLISALLLCWCSGRAGATPVEDQTTVRELCRKAVAGAYLKAQNDRDWDERYLINIKTKLSEVEKALVTGRKDLETVNSKLAKTDFDVPLSEERIRLETLVNTLAQRVSEYRKLKTDAEGRFAASVKRLKDIDGQVRGTFEVVRLDDGTEKGYPFRLNYRSNCPKYRFLCPLPPKEARNLMNIIVENNAPPESCQRYSQIAAH